MNLLPLSKWLRHPAGVLVLYLAVSNLVASFEEWLELAYPNQVDILEAARWMRKLGRVGVFVLFLALQRMPVLLIGFTLVVLYFSVYQLAGNFVANSCALLLAWTVYRLRKTESSTAGSVESVKGSVQK